MPKQRWYSDTHGLNGSPSGLAKLPNRERKALYKALVPIVGNNNARAMRDWRPTKIVQFIESMVV